MGLVPEKHPEDLSIADGVPFAAHMLVGAIKFIDGHRSRCGKSHDLEGVRQDLIAALTALPFSCAAGGRRDGEVELGKGGR